MGDGATFVRRLVGVYHAEGGIRGELAYVLGMLLGTAHCELCVLTHGPIRRKKEWDAFTAELGVPFDLVHLNERGPDIMAASEGLTPCVIAQTSRGPLIVVDRSQLAAAAGDITAFATKLRDAFARHSPTMPNRVIKFKLTGHLDAAPKLAVLGKNLAGPGCDYLSIGGTVRARSLQRLCGNGKTWPWRTRR